MEGKLYHAPTPLQTLPPMNFTDPSHFSIIHTTIVHAIDDSNGNSFWSSVLLSNPFTSGVVSITITILSLPNETLCFGLMDSTSPIPKIDEVIGYNVKISTNMVLSTTTLHLQIHLNIATILCMKAIVFVWKLILTQHLAHCSSL
ncbi:hypothetical protein BLNAU_7718 [Blattamonas nauphoetae]|uniref:Uncharacterized protein n=1 Tax=Blattamonas nauphoetae TaxID=2049346 RepID=A0ABQ9Y0T4_9EUKA|nr:hypothetical protein BLNAU_7718 [Blattamonas nauphoetae]